ncbi:hypothetical protein [Bacteriovorax sp. Seq25_V]|uniref:hypothetical protein n=1 Tax=Bacteriovorax sp. Seq25_V TaxID=1201288 RepID=UPI00038A319B|nr:hypothetical protein [Bacteriovorax sp. Seq25_V]EQC46832.1 hypothetical protein M900_2659 [Bacteriovorax sp. Seq25_V]
MKLVFAMFLSLGAFAHCPLEFKSENLCAILNWKKAPIANVDNSFEVTFWKKGDYNHVPVTPQADVGFIAWMVMDNGHQHGGPAMTWNEISEGKFEVNDAKFFMHGMKGYWQVKIQLSEYGDLVEENAVKVDLSGNGNGGGHHH